MIFTLSAFKNLEFTIPNLPEGYRIRKIESSYNRISYIVTIDWNHSSITDEYRQAYVNSYSEEDVSIAKAEGISLIHILQSYNYLDYYGVNDILFDQFYPEFHRMSSTKRRAAIWLDDLYNENNPETYVYKNGKIKQGFFTELFKRCKHDLVHNSNTTLKLLHQAEVWKYRDSGLDGEQQSRVDKLYSENYLSNLIQWLCANSKKHSNNWEWSLVIIQCHLSKEVLPVSFGVSKLYWFFNEAENQYVNDVITINRYLTDYTPYGYKLSHVENNGQRVGTVSWLIPIECILINEQVFHQNNVVQNTCDVCNNIFHHTRENHQTTCPTCLSSRYKIHGYSVKAPSLLKFKAKKVLPKTIYYGVELEYETRTFEASRIAVGQQIIGHAIMKSDGSIHNGFEIVTCPATAEIHLEEFDKFFKNFKSMGIRSESNVGMHIHISKEPLTLLTIGKMSEFLNKETNRDFLKFIAGREPNHYCKQDTNRTVTYPFVFGRDSERYNVLNLCNEATIEIRAFKTPESFEEFAAKLQFAEALTKYCMPCSVSKSLKELTEASSFIQWVKQAGKQYKYLNNFIKGTY